MLWLQPLSQILSNEPLRRQMAKKSLEIIKVHDINKVVEQYEMLYELMLPNDTGNL